MLYKYKKAFSLRDEIGTCPNTEVEIDITDKSPFFIRPYHVKEEDKNFIDTGNEVFMLFRCIKGRILSLLEPSHINQQKGYKRQKSNNKPLIFEHKNSQE